jgi:hypothetical protein
MVYRPKRSYAPAYSWGVAELLCGDRERKRLRAGVPSEGVGVGQWLVAASKEGESSKMGKRSGSGVLHRVGPAVETRAPLAMPAERAAVDTGESAGIVYWKRRMEVEREVQREREAAVVDVPVKIEGIERGGSQGVVKAEGQESVGQVDMLRV